jgi:hypothetical protein
MVSDYVPNCWTEVCCCHQTFGRQAVTGCPRPRTSKERISASSDAVPPVAARYGLVFDSIEIYHINQSCCLSAAANVVVPRTATRSRRQRLSAVQLLGRCDLSDIPPPTSIQPLESPPAFSRSRCQLNDGEKHSPSDLASITGWVVQQWRPLKGFQKERKREREGRGFHPKSKFKSKVWSGFSLGLI